MNCNQQTSHNGGNNIIESNKYNGNNSKKNQGDHISDISGFFFDENIAFIQNIDPIIRIILHHFVMQQLSMGNRKNSCKNSARETAYPA